MNIEINLDSDRDIYVLIDSSLSTMVLNKTLNSSFTSLISQLTRYHGENLTFTLVFFNTDFSIELYHDRIDSTYATDYMDIRIASSGATNPVAAMEWALNDGLVRYSLRRSKGLEPKPPAYLFWTDGFIDAGYQPDYFGKYTVFSQAEQDELEEKYFALAKKLKILQKGKQISFMAYGFSTSDRKANFKMINELTLSPERQVIEITPYTASTDLIRFFRSFISADSAEIQFNESDIINNYFAN